MTLFCRSITREEVAVKLARWLSVTRPLKRHGVTVRVPDLVTPLVAEIVTDLLVVTVRVVDIALGNGEHKQSVTQGSRRAVTILSTLGIKDLDPVPRKTQQHMA